MIEKLITKEGNRRFRIEVDIEENDESISLTFGYDVPLKDEIKLMDGARWNPDYGNWTVKNNRRNKFQLDYLRGLNPYAWYDRPLIEFQPRIPKLYPQQYKMAQEALTYHQVIWAAEMGLGKTLAGIETIEHAAELDNVQDWWWVGPKSALASFDVEVRTWGLKVYPSKVMTYDELVKVMKKWPPGLKPPKGVVFDESSRLKNLTAQRTQAAIYVAESMRDEWGENDPYIMLLTGTPSPKVPTDWYSQCEIGKPGFLREGQLHKFRNRLAHVISRKNDTTGGSYPVIVSWKDSKEKCLYCGSQKDEHDFELMGTGAEIHEFTPGINEIAKLYNRTKGLVSVYFKKDWLSHLPDKQYRVLHCKVSRAAENAMRAIKASAKTAVQALTMLRELSDGFLYQEDTEGEETCSLCKGAKVVQVPYVEGDQTDFNPQTLQELKMVETECSMCSGTGLVPRKIRRTEAVGCPKDDLLAEILDDHDEDGRLVIYAGFTGSLDRVIETVKRKGWEYIRVDGRGWTSSFHGINTPVELLTQFQNRTVGPEKLAFIGHPGSAGMGLTLTASWEIVYYSNDFNAESRIQSEDRIHRPGMDLNKGAMITDLVHLPSDMLVIDNLKKKRRLQEMSLGQFKESLKMLEEEAALLKS